ncbi:MAG: hypothetical protein IPO08_22035 [Xanthomonadales bacterium]|nr:hypothetical protein [Xanthomonadales bacterium]
MQTIVNLISALAFCAIFYFIVRMTREHTRIMQGVSYLIDQASASRYITVGGYLVEVEKLSIGYRGRLADLEGVKFHADTMAGLRREALAAIHTALGGSVNGSSSLRSLDA